MPLYSTITCKEKPGFPADVAIIDRHVLGIRRAFARVRALRRGDGILLNGALGVREWMIDVFFAIYLARFRRGITIVISDATWHPRTVPTESRAGRAFAVYSWLQKRLLLACESPRTHYCFLSSDEVRTFAAEARVDARRVHMTPFASQLPLDIVDELERSAAASSASGVVFAGGNSLRDYDTLIAAAEGIDARFLIASSNRHAHDPAKITFRFVGHHDFFREMAKSAVVVVPLLPTPLRSVGQQTYLNAMALGRPTIVSDVAGVRDHVTPDDDCLVVPPRDPEALRFAIAWTLDPGNRRRVDEIAERGRRRASTMTFAHYCERLATLLRDSTALDDA